MDSRKKRIHFSFSIKKLITFIVSLSFCLVPLTAQESDAQNQSGQDQKNTQSSSSGSEEVTTITIINARQTDYQKDEETENDTIILEGDVEVSIKKGETVSDIKAGKVTYDRKTQILYASENVSITTKTGSSGGETTHASSLIMNTSTLEGVFDDGHVIQTQSDAINLPSGSTLVVFSDVFGKSENNTIVFKDSSLTFCDDPDPHWHIDASRTWLLPGGEFAFFNALLYVGPVPVMYFPAFYYPKDELVFNPVFGYRKREGYYFQTTTYLFGRKPLDNSSSSSDSSNSATESAKGIYNFMKPSSLKEQELQGIVLHNLDKNYSGDTSSYIKFYADAYSNLGFFTGIEGNVKPKFFTYVSSMNYNLSLAFSNTIFNSSSIYIPVSSIGNRYSDGSNFLGLQLPFRYKAKLEMSFVQPFNISVSLPLYSDPYFAYDFENRQETMDWLSYLMSGIDTSEINISEISSLVWKISAAHSFNIPTFLKPYVNTFSFNYNASVNIASTQNNYISSDSRAANHDGWQYYTPERKIYYPSTVTPLNLSVALNGTLFEWPKQAVNVSAEQYELPLNKPEDIFGKEEKTEEKEEAPLDSEKKEEKKEPENKLFFTELQTQNISTSLPGDISYRLSYSFNPTYVLQTNYDPQNISQEGFDWNKKKSEMYTLKMPLELSSSFSYGKSFLSIYNNITYSPVWQEHTNLDGYTNQTDIKNIRTADYNTETQNIVNRNSILIKPFIYIPAFSQTSISWNTTLKLLRKTFNQDMDNPDWEYHGLDFSDAESVTENLLNINFASTQDDGKYSQVFVLSSSLPPQVPKISARMNLVFPYVQFNVSSGMHQKSSTDSDWVKNPIEQSLIVTLLDSNLKLSQNLNYNLEENSLDNLRFSATYKDFAASFEMANTYAYNFDDTNHTGWIAETTKSFIPYSLSLSYNYTQKTFYKWFNRISIAPSLSTNIYADLVRPTNSYFTFTPGITFKINDFFNVTFSATSRNSVLYRYFQTMLGHDGRIPGEQNIFLDLFDSFRFDDEEKRKSSGFKLKSLNLSVNHELHDWDFNMTLKFEPRLVIKNGQKYYDYNPYFTIGITWRPMQSMKTVITDEYGTIKLE